MWESIKTFFTYSLQRTLKACITLFRLMIPISVIIHFIQVANILPYISQLLRPIMQCVGLPAETSLVWLTALVVNIYGGLLSFFTIYPSLSEPLTVAQTTVLLTMILIAHTFPIELGIAQKTGIKVWVMFCIRFVFSIVAGIILFHLYKWTGWLQTPTHITHAFSTTTNTWGAWALHELKNYGLITCMIFLLVNFIHLLEVTGAIKWFNKIMLPPLAWLGISEAMLPLTVVGLTMGIAYGGGLIIAEGRKPNVKAKDIFYSMALMGLFHSIIEDTLLMLGMGGHWTGIILFRAAFAFVIVYIMVHIGNKIPENTFCRLFMTSAYNKQPRA